MTRLFVLFLIVGCTSGKDSQEKPDSQDQTLNTPPVLTLDSPRSGATVEAGAELTIAGFVVDDHDASEQLRIDLESNLGISLASPAVAPDGTFRMETTLNEGTHTLTVTATDQDGAFTIATATVEVLPPGAENHAPSQPVFHISPAIPLTSDNILLVIDVPGQDIDGDALTQYISWTVDGRPYGTSDQSTIPGEDVHLGQVWRAEVWVSDGELESPRGAAQVTVGDASPAISEVSVQPGDATVSSELSCVVVAADPEGAPLTYSYGWTIDGTPLGVAFDRLPAGTAVSGQEVICSVTVSDGTQQAGMSSAPLIIANSLPSAPTIELAPLAPADTDAISCTVVSPSVDPDGQSVSYQYAWYVNGNLSSWSDALLPASATHRDESWTCSVTAVDPSGGVSVPAEATVGIGLAWQDSVPATDADVTITGLETNALFGKTVVLTGDMDGDGLSDVAVGASGAAGGQGNEAGAVYLFGGSSLVGNITTDVAVASWPGEYEQGELAGYRSLWAPGDLDGDGLAELLFGAPEADANGADSGIVYLIYGNGVLSQGASPSSQAAWMVLGDTNDILGARISSGDIDGDGLQDVMMSATGCSDNGRLAGSVNLFLNSGSRYANIDYLNNADMTVYGDNELDEFGWTLKGIGDVNLDGYEDFAASSFYARDSAGQLGIFFGSNAPTGSGSLSQLAGARFEGALTGDRFGYDVAGQVDVDQDGIDDVAIGAYLDDTAGEDAGAMHFFLGRVGWASDYVPSDADASIYGGAAGDRFGHVIATPGDLDSDGVGDLIVGALFAEPTGALDQGAAWVLLGPDWNAYASATLIPWQAYGEAGSDLFGDAVSTGQGDTDGDGLSDFAIGAQRNDTGASEGGRVYLWGGR